MDTITTRIESTDLPRGLAFRAYCPLLPDYTIAYGATRTEARRLADRLLDVNFEAIAAIITAGTRINDDPAGLDGIV